MFHFPYYYKCDGDLWSLMLLLQKDDSLKAQMKVSIFLSITFFKLSYVNFFRYNAISSLIDGNSGNRASPVAQLVKNLPAMREIWVWSLGWEDPLEDVTATHCSILVWRIPMNTGVWSATVREAAESDMTGWLSSAQMRSGNITFICTREQTKKFFFVTRFVAMV